MPSRQIQICDDDPAAAMITQRGLQALLGDSVAIVVAPTANAAWLACANGNVDLLIIDPSPHNNAAASLLRAVRTFRPRLPVLILTAYDSPGLRARMRDLGIEYYVPKPVDLRELAPIVYNAIQLGRPLNNEVSYRAASAL